MVCDSVEWRPKRQLYKIFSGLCYSFHNTTVNFQIGGNTVIKRLVIAGQVTIFKSPSPKSPGGDITLDAEIHSSGIVENKAVHVWSDDADLSVYFLSRINASGDGMYVLPTTGWGKEYVVAGYSSLLIPANQGDFPSEFVVVAEKNNTQLTIIPSMDLRKDGFPNVIDHPRGIPFTQMLNKGECIQYQVTGSPQDDAWDVSGTIITSNNPIGVMGASVCPFIPVDKPYCDYILDMLQPVRSWSNNYFTAPFAGRKYGGDAFLLVASKDSQIILQNGMQVALINKYQHLFLYDIKDPSIWKSDAPFMLVQYIESTTAGAPTGANPSFPDPAMVVMNGADQFRKDLIFQTPRIDVTSGQTDFTNYVNIVIPANHEVNTTYDGHPIGGGALPNIQLIEKLPIPNTSWEAIRLTYKNSVGEGVHSITSDTGVGVYAYGYANYESYAWSGHLGTVSILNSNDTIPPTVTESGNCFSFHVIANDILPSDSKLGQVVTDTMFNMLFTLDSNFVPGAGIGTSFYDLHIVDSTKEAIITVSIYDLAGNRTTVTSIYKPQIVKFSVNPLNFGVGSVGNFSFLYDTICNTGSIPFHFKTANLSLVKKSVGFSIDSIGADGDIPVGGCRVIKIRFAPLSPPTVRDTLAIFDTCSTIICLLVGNAGVPDFALSDFNFGCIDLGKVSTVNATIASNFGAGAITIDSIWTDDPVHFTFSGTPKLPTTIKVNDQLPFQFIFAPTTKDTICTTVHFLSAEAGVRTAKLCGCGQTPASVQSDEYSSSISKGSEEYSLISAKLDHGDDLVILPPVPNPLLHGENSIRFDYGLKYDSQSGLAIYDILGNLVATIIQSGFQNAGIYEINFPIPSKMTSGAYIYRLFGAGRVLSGKLVVSK